MGVFRNTKGLLPEEKNNNKIHITVCIGSKDKMQIKNIRNKWEI